MSGGPTRKISPASARAHTRRSNHKSSSISGKFKKILFVFFIGFLAYAYKATCPPPPKICGTPEGPPVTAPRIKLKDGRYLAYKEFGVPRVNAKRKIVFIHGFDCTRHDFPLMATISADTIESLGIYIVSFDRPGYGESDPNPKRTPKTLAHDIEELADQLEFGSKFYVVGYSMGGQAVWPCLKYIPHRLAGATLVAPVVNYWWPTFPANLATEPYHQQLMQDQWALRVAHYLPWLTYWWNTQKFFPGSSVIARSGENHSQQDKKLIPKIIATVNITGRTQVRQQGEFESIHRDLMIGFGDWEFDPMGLENLFPNGGGSVHLWMGDEDRFVPVTLQRYIARHLSWICYHELHGAGHMFPFADGMGDAIIKALLSERCDLP